MGIGVSVIKGELHSDNLVGSPGTILINYLDTEDQIVRKELQKFVMTEVDSELDVKPQCVCGFLKSAISLLKDDTVCPNCKNKVMSPLDKAMMPLVFLRTPKGISKMMLPRYWMKLTDVFSKRNFNAIAYLTDSTYRTSDKTSAEKIADLGYPRDYNFFIDNFYPIIETLANHPLFKTKAKAKSIVADFKKNHNEAFTDSIYMPNKALLVVENTPLGRWTDVVFIRITAIINGIAGIDLVERPIKKKGQMLSRFMTAISDKYDYYYRTMLSGRKGAFLTLLFRTKSLMSGRFVITSITDPHHYEEVHMPWAGSLHIFKTHLISKLIRKHNFTMNDAALFIDQKTHVFDELLYTLLNELLSESRDGGIRTIKQRYPTLLRGAFDWCKITKFKRDVTDPTISVSILTLWAMNADLDGDSEHIVVLPDNFTADGYEAFAYHYNCIEPTEYRKISKNLSLTPPVSANISHWLSCEDPVDPDIEKSMLAEFGV